MTRVYYRGRKGKAFEVMLPIATVTSPSTALSGMATVKPANGADVPADVTTVMVRCPNVVPAAIVIGIVYRA